MIFLGIWQKRIISAVIVILLVVGVYFGWRYFQKDPATGESQKQAETPRGVDIAAHNAQVKMYQDQLEEAAKQIAAFKNKPPDLVIKTIPVEVVKTVEAERQKRGADFAIVTDPKQPDKTVKLKEVEKLPADTSVTLNQYNVFAYKKIVRGINIYPKFDGLKPTGVSEVTIDVSRKISNDGKYIGVVGGYDFDNKKVKAGVRLTY
jgi:predicted negative regulator of RcsB-dependent stress response